MKILGLIPARYAASRFPGKPLALIGGKSMVQRVYEQASAAGVLSEVAVATDDERIYQHVRAFGGQVIMTRPDHPSGTDRCAEAVGLRDDIDVVVNIQGDEPFIRPDQIAAVTAPFAAGAGLATLARRIADEEDLWNPNVVKVTVDRSGRALYFSRHPIPYLRDVPREDWLSHGLHLQHLGLYAYRRDVLLELTQLAPGTYERAEGLEQLRWLQAGYRLHVALTEHRTIGIDTPEDLQRAEAWLISGGDFSRQAGEE